MFQEIRQDLCRSLSKWIRQHTGNADIGNGHAVLNAVFFRRFHADQLKAVSGDFPELAEIFWRNKRITDKIKFKKVCNPFGILFVRLFPFDRPDILWMCKTDINIMFQIIKNRNPVFAGGFHADVPAVVFN